MWLIDLNGIYKLIEFMPSYVDLFWFFLFVFILGLLFICFLNIHYIKLQ